MTTQNIAKALLPWIEAAAAGKTVQFLADTGTWADIVADEGGLIFIDDLVRFIRSHTQLRIKAEKKRVQ